MPLDPNIAIGPLGPTPWAGVMAGINAGQEAATQRQQIALQKAQQAIEEQRAQAQAKYYEQIAANEQAEIKQRAETAAASLAEKKAEAEQRQETARLNRESRDRIAARRDAGNNKLTAQEWKNYSQSLRDAVFLGYQPGSPEAERYAMGMLEDFRRQFAGDEAQPSASVDAIAASPPPNVLLPSVAPQAAPFGQGPRVGGLIPASPLTPKAPVPGVWWRRTAASGARPGTASGSSKDCRSNRTHSGCNGLDKCGDGSQRAGDGLSQDNRSVPGKCREKYLHRQAG